MTTTEAPEAAASSSIETLRPNRKVFIWRSVVRASLLWAAIALAGYLFSPLFLGVTLSSLWWWGLFLGATGLVFANRWVAYGRTRYEWHPDRLRIHTGSIAQQGTIDLPYRNITQVELKLPFIEHRLYATGHLSVRAAGSAQGIAHLHSIDAPHKAYEAIADRLREHGFSLDRDQELQRERPHLIGTLLDTSGLAIGGLVAVLSVGLTIGGGVLDLMDLQSYYDLFDVLAGDLDADDPQEEQAALRATLGLATLMVLAATAGLAKLVIHFIDLNRRTYTLYDDVVDYQDGFLTETYRFIPIENLADTATEAPFLKRLFGMADVHLSPHGSSTGIRFPSMPRAAEFRRHLDRLIDASESVPGPVDAGSMTAATEAADDATAAEEESLEGPGISRSERLPPPRDEVLSFRPSFVRRATTGVINAAKFPLFLAAVVAAGWAAIAITAFDLEAFDLPLDEIDTTLAVQGWLGLWALLTVHQLATAIFACMTVQFEVGRKKISWTREFLSRDEVEFTMDKIATLLVERDFIDRLMGTATITFRSIGNDTPLVFTDIARSDRRLIELRERLGLREPREEVIKTYRPTTSILNLLTGRLGVLIAYAILAIAAVAASTIWHPDAIWGAAVAPALALISLGRHAIYYRFAKVHLFDDHIIMRRGLIFVEHDYVPLDQIRSVASTTYPGRRAGTLRLVPGSSHHITMPYIEDLAAIHDDLDRRLHQHPMRPTHQPQELNTDTVSTRRPMARNRLVLATLISLGVALITVIPALWLFLHARRTSLEVQQGRVRRRWGLLYRTTQTVVYNRVDQLMTHRGLLHSILGNGEVRVLTVGSSLPELNLGPIADHEALYDELESRIPGR